VNKKENSGGMERPAAPLGYVVVAAEAALLPHLSLLDASSLAAPTVVERGDEVAGFPESFKAQQVRLQEDVTLMTPSFCSVR
jgi:hypothetical protein